MDGISREENPIIYIDEIHGLVGAGATGEGAMDASNMLKPYLETGKIRFIGSTTYDEYKRHFAKSKGLVRRFRQIDIPEPSIQETISIISKLKGNYENFHGVILPDKTIEFAVTSAARHLSDRFLPDKAIDLIDEAGAYRRIHPLPSGEQTVDVDLIAEVLSKICKVDSISIKEDDTSRLESLEPRILSKIFRAGQGGEERHGGSTDVEGRADRGFEAPCLPAVCRTYRRGKDGGGTRACPGIRHRADTF